MSTSESLGEILKRDSQRLATALNLDFSTARIEVQCLLQSVLNVNRAYLLTHPERVLNADEVTRYQALCERRMLGEPVAYLLGVREFYGLDFKVTPATLIPRPDTELLVELALQKVPSSSTGFAPLPLLAGKAGRGIFRVLDMGTGSGAIALSIAHERPDVHVVAVDASEAALAVATENAQCLGIDYVRFLHSDWFSKLSGECFDLIVSNPPYIEADDEHLSQGDVRFEPMSALASGSDGLDDIRRILKDAKAHLYAGGWLMFEHGYNQAERVRQLLQQHGYREVASLLDLAGIERVTLGRA